MASTGLYSQHRNNRGLLHLRNTLIALVLVIFAGIIVGVLLALLERIREINGGEEDEAIQY